MQVIYNIGLMTTGGGAMAQCKLTPREFIVNAFAPQVAAVCSASAEATCQKNNLSFIELLQPFCRLSTEGELLGFCTFFFSSSNPLWGALFVGLFFFFFSKDGLIHALCSFEKKIISNQCYLMNGYAIFNVMNRNLSTIICTKLLH